MQPSTNSGNQPSSQRPPNSDATQQADDEAGQVQADAQAKSEANSQANSQEDAQAANNGKGAPTGDPNDVGQAGDYSR